MCSANMLSFACCLLSIFVGQAMSIIYGGMDVLDICTYLDSFALLKNRDEVLSQMHDS